jgi:23S rRNA (guanosine2251-2'-O)-methyltransferase
MNSVGSVFNYFDDSRIHYKYTQSCLYSACWDAILYSVSDTIEGRQPVLEALRSGRAVNRILLARDSERHGAVAEILSLARQRGIPFEYVDRKILERSAFNAVHQGVLAYAAAKEYISLADLLSISHTKGEPPLFCILDGLEDPHNLGAILRTAGAAGMHGLIIRNRREVGLTSVVAKASAGAIEYVPVARVANIAQAVETLKKKGVWVVGVEACGKMTFDRVDFKLPTAIVIGGEGTGISDLVSKKCDVLVSIPMCGSISSLNASVAAALVMYEAFRQRTC